MKKSLFALHHALILLLLVWQWKEPSQVANPLVIALAATLPLLAFSAVLLRPTRNTLVFYLLLQLLYFTHAVVSFVNPMGHWSWPLLELLLTVAIFCLAVLIGRRMPA